MLRVIGISLLLCLISLQSSLAQSSDDEELFLERLEVMQANIEKSIKVIRDQITENQTAPFIADLYMQLGDLLTQNANAYYYIFMERAKNSDSLDTGSISKSTPIVNAQKEAATIYQRVLDSFPDFEKRAEVLHRLTLLYHDLQMDASMKMVGHQLIKEYPTEKQAMQVRVLIGQSVFQNGEYEEARSYFLPVSRSSFPYERNSARIQLGLLAIQEEKFKTALGYFEEVVTDDTLVEVPDEREQFLSGKVVQDNLKREALNGSVRAYTEVHKKKADPLKYYSNIAPTEELFLYSIEKLSNRFIVIKRYAEAVELLRVLSESMSDPQKIVNIYKDALRIVPLKERAHLPAEEVNFIIQKFVDWRAAYQIDNSTLKAATIFFERQLRDIATRSHDVGKVGQLDDNKRAFLEKANELYLLYLAVFPKSPHSLKMAINLGDVHFRLGNFLRSGEFYTRAFRGEFGAPKPEVRKSLLRNAMISLQKEQSEAFYDQMRSRGLLVSTIHSLFKLDPRWRETDRPNFLLAKAYYDLGYYRQGISSLYNFIKKFPRSKLSADAGELILDYYNIRDDLPNLNRWADRLLALGVPNPQFNSRVQAVKLASATRQLDQEILKKGSFDAFAEGRSYLNMAVEMKNSPMADMAMSRALAMSKEEGDVDTFLATAKAMAAADSSKRAVILQSMALEAYRVGRYSEAIDYWQQLARLTEASPTQKQEAHQSALRTAALLRDYSLVAKLSGSANLPPELRAQLLSSLEEPVRPSPELLQLLLQQNLDESEFYHLAKNHFSFPGPLRSRVSSMLQSRCKAQPQQEACQWYTLAALSQRALEFRDTIQKTPGSFEYMEREALNFSTLLESFQRLQGTSDAVVAIVVSLRISSLYSHFADFLGRVAKQTPEVAELLNAKIAETQKISRQVMLGCRDIISQSNLVSPVNAYCLAGKEPSLVQATKWPAESFRVRQPSSQNPARNKDILQAQKSIFTEEQGGSEHLLELSYQFYIHGHWPQAVASASQGISQYSAEASAFKEILGCSLGEMNYLNEASYHLDGASSRHSLLNECRGKIRNKLRAI